MQLLARFLLDRRRVGLERLDLVDVQTIFFLQALDVILQRLHLGALLPVYDHAIGSEHGVQQYAHDQNNRGCSPETTPLQCQPRPRRPRTLDPPRRRSLSPRSLILSLPHSLAHRLIEGRAQTFLSPWKEAHSRRWP